MAETAQQALQHLAVLRDQALAQPPSQWCQAFFLATAGAVVLLQAFPQSLRSILMDYGPRGTDQTSSNSRGGSRAGSRGSSRTAAPPPPPSGLKKLLRAVTSIGQVPHAWFWHFYFLSIMCSTFWIWQYLSKGRVMGALAEWQRAATAATAGSEAEEEEVVKKDLGRFLAAWLMMAMQGTRRLHESLFVMRTGTGSSMWFVHWAMGLAFYAVMSISVWIEGSGTFLTFGNCFVQLI